MKFKFIFALHGTVFTAFTLLNMLINNHVVAFLERALNYAWLIQIVDLLISGFLYVLLYTLLSSLYKFINIRIKKEILPIGGKWYHVHLKCNAEGYIKTDVLRAGETTVKQDLCEVRFDAVNHSYRLTGEGVLVRESNQRKNTGWSSWSVDWNGKENLITCYKALTQTKNTEEYTDRHGIHKLKISGEEMFGKFADEYPSASRGDIYFFRSEEKRDEFMRDFLTEMKAAEKINA